MKKLALPLTVATAFLLAACGDETTQVNQMGMEVADSVEDLSKCTKDREGEQAFVKDEGSARICIDGDWVSMMGDYSCKTVELKDGSGLKIVCNGDSIGVVLNGADGKDGKSGKDGKDGEDGADGSDGKDAVIPQDSLENDSERVAISLDSLVGYTQKGPFLRGSTVYLYELSDGRTLKQTNGNFTSNIARDDGRYKFNARDLVSQYAMVVVDGYYRNEVTGVSSEAPIRLKAITDMRKHNSVNVNILTHMEFERVYHLVTRDGKTVKAAKKQAQKEILKIFDIELAEGADAEDMDVFGSSDADAALLAVSVLLLGDRTESELMALLSEISNDMATDGIWSGDRADSIKAVIADWVMSNDFADKLDSIRKHVEGWRLSTGAIPDFEKKLRTFASKELRLGVCDGSDDTVGTVKHVANPNSQFYVESYEDTLGVGYKTRLICIDAKTARWRPATELEKDRYDWKHEKNVDGAIFDGRVTGKKMTWDKDTLRYAWEIEIKGDKGCSSYNRDSLWLLKNFYSYYKCLESGWSLTTEKLNYGSITDDRDGETYRTVGVGTQMWMAENLRYQTKSGSSCYESQCELYGRQYQWPVVGGCACMYVGEVYAVIQFEPACPEGWSLPTKEDWETLMGVIVGNYGLSSSYGLSLIECETPGCSFDYWSSTEDASDETLHTVYVAKASKAPPSGGQGRKYDSMSITKDDKESSHFVRCIKN